MATNRIAERKLRDKQARRAQILSAARRIAELEGWSHVTVRRLSDEISYSQPVLYSHFGSREGILAAVAIEGFQEIGVALEKARKRVKVEMQSNRSRPHIWGSPRLHQHCMK
jgi:AcrR family transcriptional regulator